MILIDKEKLMNHIKGFLGIKSPSRVFLEKFDIEWDDVENASTVEAIPIEWIEDYMEILKGHVAYTIIKMLIDDWRKENEKYNI